MTTAVRERPDTAQTPQLAANGLSPELQALINRVKHQVATDARIQRIKRENRDFLFGRFLFE